MRIRLLSIVILTLCLPRLAQAQNVAATTAQAKSAYTDKLYSSAWGQSSLEYRFLCEKTYRQAEAQLRYELCRSCQSGDAISETHEDSPSSKKAVILDIDETVLDNSPAQARFIENQTTFDPAIWTAWCLEKNAEPIPGVVEFITAARKLKVEVFFVSNREFDADGKMEAATVGNLSKVLGYKVDPDRVLLKNEQEGWSSDKSSRRLYVASRARVELLVGDDFNDFATLGKLAPAQRRQQADKFHEYANRWILLPNPVYGSWENAVNGYRNDLTAEERRERMRAVLDAGKK